MKDRVEGKIPTHAATVDVLVTGCEVSLWLGEQFASDLQKAFPKLFIQATSSNKLLGVFGQELVSSNLSKMSNQQERASTTNDQEAQDTPAVVQDDVPSFTYRALTPFHPKRLVGALNSLGKSKASAFSSV